MPLQNTEHTLRTYFGLNWVPTEIPTKPLPAHLLFDSRAHVFGSTFAILKFQSNVVRTFADTYQKLTAIHKGHVSRSLLERVLYSIQDPREQALNTKLLQENFEFPNMYTVLSRYRIHTLTALRHFATQIGVVLESRDSTESRFLLKLWQLETAPLRTWLAAPIVNIELRSKIICKEQERSVNDELAHFYLSQRYPSLFDSRFRLFSTRIVPNSNIVLMDNVERVVILISAREVEQNNWQAVLSLINKQIKAPGRWSIRAVTVADMTQGVYLEPVFLHAFLYWFVEIRLLKPDMSLSTIEAALARMFSYNRNTSENIIDNYSHFISAVSRAPKSEIARDLLKGTQLLNVDRALNALRPPFALGDGGYGLLFPLTKDLRPVVNMSVDAPQTTNRDKAGLLYLSARHGSVCLETDVENLLFEVRADRSIRTNVFAVARGAFSCQKSSRKRFVAISVSILEHGEECGHHNSLLYDAQTGEMEWFEPNGINVGVYLESFVQALDDAFRTFVPGYNRLLLPIQVCNAGLQNQQGLRADGCSSGTCVPWSVLYQDIRLMYPDVERGRLLLRMTETLSLDSSLFSRVISPFQRFLSLLDISIAHKNQADALRVIQDLISKHIFIDQAWRATAF
jgi:hypothetical protein